MKHAIGPRREIGIRTVFNILGPLSNPAGASVQLLGVYSEALTETLAPTLRPELDTWSLILLGAGGIILLEVVIRVLVPAYRQPVTGSLIFAVILIAIGLGDLFSWQLVWPIVLIIIGISVLLGGLSRGRGPRE